MPYVSLRVPVYLVIDEKEYTQYGVKKTSHKYKQRKAARVEKNAKKAIKKYRNSYITNLKSYALETFMARNMLKTEKDYFSNGSEDE